MPDESSMLGATSAAAELAPSGCAADSNAPANSSSAAGSGTLHKSCMPANSSMSAKSGSAAVRSTLNASGAADGDRHQDAEGDRAVSAPLSPVSPAKSGRAKSGSSELAEWMMCPITQVHD